MEPKIRFKGFEGEWKAPLFSEMVERISASGQAGMLPGVEFEDIASGEGCFNKNIYQKECHKYGKLFYEGDILFGKLRPYLKNIILANFNGVAIGDFWVLRSKGLDEKYLYTLVNSESFLKVANISSGSKMPRADWNLVSTTKFVVPSAKDEQKAIGKYFTSLDSQISASTSRLASLKQMKAASLQAMFPQEGETVPKIRFKGFEGEWKKVSFKDFTFHAGTKNRDNLPLESYSISNEFGFIPQNEQFENGGTMTQADKRMYYIVSPNSFAYNPARINVGSLGYYEGKEDVIVSSLYEVFKTDDTICDKFLLYWFKTDIFQKMIEQFQEGGVRLYFFYDKMCKCSLMRPPLAEQQAIASYFNSLDRQISLQSQRLEKLKQIKSACLDKMFV